MLLPVCAEGLVNIYIPTNKPSQLLIRNRLVGFYGISSTVAYLMPSPVYIYAKYIGLVNAYFIDNIFSKLELICLHTAE